MKFSITIPAYKQRYLYEAIESCLAQTYKDFELIIVDDASPEDLKTVVDKFHDDRIRYYRNEKNCGALNVVDNWNICLSYAKGDYVICMGDDDRLLPHCLEEYLLLLKKYPNLNVYHALTEIIDDNSRFCYMQEMRPEREGVFSMIYGRLHNRRQQYIGDWLFSVKWLKSNGGYVKNPMAWGSDDLTAFIAAQRGGVANSQVPMFQYRENQQTISSSGNIFVKIQAMLITFGIIKEMLDEKSDELTDLEQHYRQTIQRVFHDVMHSSMSSLLQQSVVSNGIFNSFYWWIKHRKKNEISCSELLKAIIKSLNK